MKDSGVATVGLTLAAVLGCGNSESAGLGKQVVFERPDALTVTAGRAKVAVADLDGDRHLDLAAITDSGRLHIFGGLGDGTFVERRQLELVTSGGIGAGDVDGDGLADIVLARSDGSELVVVWGGATKGVLRTTPPELNQTAGDAMHVLLRDMDRDNRMEVVVAGTLGVDIQKYAGDGTGTFANLHNFALTWATGTAVGDLDGDGWNDLVVSAGNTPAAFIRQGDGQGFQPGVILAGENVPTPLDVDQDGDLDVVFTHGRLVVHLNDGQGRLREKDGVDPLQFVTRTFYMTGVAAADFDGDGRQDLALSTTHAPGLLLGTADGWFVRGLDLSEAFWSIAGGDFDEDGRPDLVTTHPAPPRVHVLLNRTR